MNEHFEICDLYECGFYLARGSKLVGIRQDADNPRRKIFLLSPVPSSELIKEWATGAGVVNALAYARSIKELKHTLWTGGAR